MNKEPPNKKIKQSKLTFTNNPSSNQSPVLSSIPDDSHTSSTNVSPSTSTSVTMTSSRLHSVEMSETNVTSHFPVAPFQPPSSCIKPQVLANKTLKFQQSWFELFP